RAVAPGFIDLHSHSGLVLFADGRHEPKVRQGVTTEVIGVDGLSYAPFADARDLADLVEMNAGLDGRPDGLDPAWTTAASYLGRFDGRTSVNVAMLVGNSALRIGAVGWRDEPASDRALESMRSNLREAMEEGAFGLSSGLDYPPGAYATTDELAALAAEAARHGGFYHSHVRYDLGDRFLDPFREAIEIGRRGAAPAHLTHFYHRATFPGSPEEMLALVDDARAGGLDVTFDAYPYEWASTRLLIMLPIWVQDGGPRPTKERLADRAARDRIRAEMRERGTLYAGAGGLGDVRIGAFTRPENRRWEGRTLGELCAETGVDPVDAVCDLLLGEDLRVNEVTPGPHTDGIRRFYRHPAAMVGTDSTFVGAKPSPRSYGSYPRILGQFVRDEGVLGLEEAVAKMTSRPAARLGLRDRGVLRDGAVADVVVFDPVRVRSNATYDEPRRFPDGIEQVLVGGVAVVEAGRHTGATPGRALRRGRD
ncbi:MAG TPA: amidohydrolase family protein, partial [Candidatus Limnocylindrales bacterium]|nr:amidohydrolase family protein [Candidatus Limnocylindrales bacterium]